MECRDCVDDDRYLHEPRVLWTVERVQAPASAAVQSTGRVQVNKDHFRNTSRYPMTLTKLCVAAINYTMREHPDQVQNLTDVHNSAIIQNLIKVFLSAPYSMHLTREDLISCAMTPNPTSEPGMFYSESAPYASGIWGVTRWQLDRPLILPNESTVQFDLSTYTVPNLGIPSGDFAAEGPIYTVSFEEEHTGIFGGNNRLSPRRRSRPSANNPPFEGDAWAVFAAPGGDSNNTWDQGVEVRADAVPVGSPGPSFRAQEANRGQDMNVFTAYAIAIDQISYDELLQTGASQVIGERICPMSMRMATRARTQSGGTNEWWWRPGAPLCLVTPTITPALVYTLPKPIELAPGEEIEMEIEVPVGPTVVPFEGPPAVLFQPTYQIGLSLTGYASIERGGKRAA